MDKWFLTSVQKQFSQEKTVFSTNDTATIEYTCAKMNFNPYSVPYKKINSKWIKDPNVELNTIKLLEEYMGEILCDLAWGQDFLDTTSKAHSIKEKTW